MNAIPERHCVLSLFLEPADKESQLINGRLKSPASRTLLSLLHCFKRYDFGSSKTERGALGGLYSAPNNRQKSCIFTLHQSASACFCSSISRKEIPDLKQHLRPKFAHLFELFHTLEARFRCSLYFRKDRF